MMRKCENVKTQKHENPIFKEPKQVKMMPKRENPKTHTKCVTGLRGRKLDTNIERNVTKKGKKGNNPKNENLKSDKESHSQTNDQREIGWRK